MAWQTVAVGSFDELRLMAANQELQKGTRVRVEMELSVPVGWAFDLAGVEKLFPMPEGMDMVDVWGEGSRKAVVELEADPAWLVPMVLFLGANWKAVVIATAVGAFVLLAIVSLIKILVQVVKAPGAAFSLLLVGGIAAIGLGLLLATDPRFLRRAGGG